MNPVKAPDRVARVVTGYCRPTGQDCSLHASLAAPIALLNATAMLLALYRLLTLLLHSLSPRAIECGRCLRPFPSRIIRGRRQLQGSGDVPMVGGQR